jgi:hypothetical protein
MKNCFWGHDFSKWEKVTEGEIADRSSGIRKVKGFYIRQQRKCLSCDYIETNLQEEFI